MHNLTKLQKIDLKFQFTLLFGAIIFGFLFNRSCVENNFCDSDPIYGTSCSVCTNGSFSDGAYKVLESYLLFNTGAYLKESQIKEELTKEFNG